MNQAQELDEVGSMPRRQLVTDKEERAWRQERMVRWILEPSSNGAILPDVMVGLVFHWVMTLDHDQLIIYFHHLLGFDRGKTAETIGLSEQEDAYVILLRAAAESIDLCHEICLQGVDMSEYYRLWMDLRSNISNEEFCKKYNTEPRVALVMKEYVRHIHS